MKCNSVRPFGVWLRELVGDGSRARNAAGMQTGALLRPTGRAHAACIDSSPWDTQEKRLLCHGGCGEQPRIQSALGRLRGFDVVGLTDRIGDFWLALSTRLGWGLSRKQVIDEAARKPVALFDRLHVTLAAYRQARASVASFDAQIRRGNRGREGGEEARDARQLLRAAASCDAPLYEAMVNATNRPRHRERDAGLRRPDGRGQTERGGRGTGKRQPVGGNRHLSQDATGRVTPCL